jgi:hypothetical protein
MPYTDPEKRRENTKRYQVTDRFRELRRAQYKKHKAKQRAYQKEWTKNNPVRVKASARRSLLRCKYGITVEQWEQQFNQQGRCCAICATKTTDKWHTDHDHDTGAFRGILCHGCNTGLGSLKDNVVICRAAALYLEAFGK